MAVKLKNRIEYEVDTFSDIILDWGNGCIIHCLENNTWWNIINGVLVEQLTKTVINRKVIANSNDFPTPDVNGFIQLADFTTYQINGFVSGNFKFKLGIKTSFTGIDRVNDKLLSTTTGVMFDMDGTVTPKSNIFFIDITIGAVNGTLFNVVSSAQNQAIGMISVTISATKHLGVINNISTWAMTNCVMRNTSTNSGFVITGNNGTIKSRLAVFSNNAGTMFDFTNSTNEVIDFNNNQIASSSGQTFMSAILSNVSVWGKLNNNTFTGAGSYITGITGSSNIWSFIGNLGIANNSVVTSYTHNQSTPSDTWIVTHNLGFHPNVIIVDSANSVVIGGTTYNSLNQLTLYFATGFSGIAYLS